jgi:hypothetical protein
MRTERAIVALGISAALLSPAVPLAGQGRGGAGNRVAATRPWPPERLEDGQPDVQGIWSAVSGGSVSLTDPVAGGQVFEKNRPKVPSRIIDPSNGEIPYQPWAAARVEQQAYDYEHPTRPEHIDTQHWCLIPSVPRLYYIVPPFKIIQPPGSVVFMWDAYHTYRVIPLEGQPHVGSDLKLWMGDGRGRWEGNTLVIDTTNLNGRVRLTYRGDFYTTNAHLVERLTFVDANTMNYEVTIDDPTVFTQPWTMRVPQTRRPDQEMWETACYEGEKNAERMLKLTNPQGK